MSAPSNVSFQVPPTRIWNICMLAHVDHGKSAISDSLISANGIISTRSAGKIRYLDSREDEQRRGITMKSSSIALGHRKTDSPGHVDFSGEVEAALRICDGAVIVVDVVEGVCVQTVTVLRAALEHALRPILVLNKIDRLFAELHLDPMEAYRHIVNILEQVNVIMGVRQVEQMMAAALDLSSDVSNSINNGDNKNSNSEWQFDDHVSSDKAISGYFSPELGNVVFASAIDGWAFRIVDFAQIFSKRFGLSQQVLTKTLWGDYYLQSKLKRIVRKTPEVRNNAKPMFVQFILANIHAIYDALHSTQHDHELAIEKRKKFVDKLGLKVTTRDLKHRDTSTALHAIMNAWLPAAACLLNTITEQLPNAKEAQAQKERLQSLWPHADRILQVTDPNSSSPSSEQSERCNHFKKQYDAISSTSTDLDAPMLAFVAKMIEAEDDSNNSVNMKIRTPKGAEELEATRRASQEPSSAPSDSKDDEVPMIAFARIFSGTIQVGDSVYVYSPRYTVAEDGSYDPSTVTEAVVTGLSLLMGRGTDAVTSASAGTVVGIRGLDDAVLKTATLSSEPPGFCLPAGSASTTTLGLDKEAVVRVAVEPHVPSDLKKLQSGLRRLNQADPAVETLITAKGEHVIAANGELHLERCLKDLRERFAKGARVHVSKPIVSFRETVIGGVSPNVDVPKVDENNQTVEKRDVDGNIDEHFESMVGGSGGRSVMRVEPKFSPSKTWDSAILKHGRFIRVGNDSVWFRLMAVPLPMQVAKVLDDIGSQIQLLEGESDRLASVISKGRDQLAEAMVTFAQEQESRKQRVDRIVQYWRDELFPRVWGCGPRGIGSNIIVGPNVGKARSSVVCDLFGSPNVVDDEPVNPMLRDVEKAIVSGFQLAIRAGPLCEEPMHGVAIFIEEIRFGNNINASQTSCEDSKSQEENPTANASVLGGMVIGWMREAVRLCVMHGNARLLEGMLHVDISVPDDVLGKTYTVIGQRRGRVLNEDMKEGVHVFGITAYIPVEASFGFTDVLRKHTSGFAVPQMVFSHWEMVDMDPFWFAQTEEELEDVGVADMTAEHNNLARKLVNGVRRRKGLKIDEKIVEKAEKQRTLSRKK